MYNPNHIRHHHHHHNSPEVVKLKSPRALGDGIKTH